APRAAGRGPGCVQPPRGSCSASRLLSLAVSDPKCTASAGAANGAAQALRSASVAVTAGQEYGLFIGGEVVEPASGEIRDLNEPATGAPLARTAMAGEADVDRAVTAACEAL